jgi:hypothetical protein
MNAAISQLVSTESQTQQGRLIPLAKWDIYHPFPTVPALRWMRFNGDKNGFNGCILKVGKRVLIDEAKFFQWVRNNGQAIDNH